MSNTPLASLRVAVELLGSKLQEMVDTNATATEWVRIGFEISEVMLRGQGDLIEMQLVACRGGDIRLGAAERRAIHAALQELANLHRRAVRMRALQPVPP